MRTFGYMLAKSLLFRELEAGITPKALPPPPTTTRTDSSSGTIGLSYAVESHGMWILKGYIPVNAMNCVSSSRPNMNHPHYPLPVIFELKKSALKYALAHQQLEAVIQLEYTAAFSEGFIQVRCRVDNIRLHVVKLGFKKNKQDGHEDDNDGDVLTKERHFPSRVRVWVGPEVGANYVGSLSLGRSTDNTESEVEMQKVLKGSFGKLKIPKVKGMARVATRTKLKNWRWDQDVEGNAAIFDGILCDNTTGVEIASGGGGENYLMVNNFSRRYNGGNRPFTKSGGLVFAGEDCGSENGVGWRLSKEMEGSVLKWRFGVQVWLSYWPKDVKSSYYETRRVEWCEEVDLPLIPGKYT